MLPKEPRLPTETRFVKFSKVTSLYRSLCSGPSRCHSSCVKATAMSSKVTPPCNRLLTCRKIPPEPQEFIPTEPRWNCARYSLSVTCAQLLSCVRLFVTPWTVACRAPLSIGFPRQECWSVVKQLPPQ